MANINASTLRIGSNDLILQDAAARASMAPAYSASSTYAVGDIVLKDGQLYECTTAISTAEAWTAAHWTAVTVGGELTDLKEDLTQTKLYLVDNTDVLTLSPWANKRVTADGLVYSPSQLTTENVIYLGKGNILSLEAQSTTRQISISYYSIGANGDMTYINSDVFRINYLKYIGVKYDFARLSFVGSSSDPPSISEFSAHLKHVQYNEFLGKNLSFLGDSITTYKNISETSDSVNAPYYPTGDISFPEQCYWKMFSDAVSGGNLSVSAISNSSWRNQGNTSCPSAYENVRITRLSANGTPDYVFINMGTNDPYSNNIGSEIGYTYDVETLEANVVYSSYAIQTTIRKIQVAYPNAKIILLIPKFPSAIGTGNYTFEKWEKLCDYMVQIANMYGVYKIVDMRKCGITVDTMSSDCIGGAMHPNYNGMKKMGAYLINELIN